MDAEAATVQRIYDLYATGEHSDVDVAQNVNGETGVLGEPVHRTKRGRPFTESSIRTVLNNRIYIGDVVWHAGEEDGEVRQGRHQPLIEAPQFEPVQSMRKRRTHFTGRPPAARTYPLTRRARCFHCGTPVAGDTGGKKGYRRMRHARTGLSCEWRTQSAERLEDQLGGFLADHIALPKSWQVDAQKLLTRPDDLGRADQIQRERVLIEQALESLRKPHTWK